MPMPIRTILKSVIATTLILLLCTATNTYAHVVKIDGSIGVTIHISPDDEPVAGEKAGLFVEINDRSERFHPQKKEECHCVVAISQEHEQLEELDLLDEKGYKKLEYVFPRGGTYQIAVKGQPRQEASFQPFETSFSYFITPGKTESPLLGAIENPLQGWFPYLVLATFILIILMIFIPARLTSKGYDKKNI